MILNPFVKTQKFHFQGPVLWKHLLTSVWAWVCLLPLCFGKGTVTWSTRFPQPGASARQRPTEPWKGMRCSYAPNMTRRPLGPDGREGAQKGHAGPHTWCCLVPGHWVSTEQWTTGEVVWLHSWMCLKGRAHGTSWKMKETRLSQGFCPEQQEGRICPPACLEHSRGKQRASGLQVLSSGKR